MMMIIIIIMIIIIVQNNQKQTETKDRTEGTKITVTAVSWCDENDFLLILGQNSSVTVQYSYWTE